MIHFLPVTLLSVLCYGDVFRCACAAPVIMQQFPVLMCTLYLFLKNFLYDIV